MLNHIIFKNDTLQILQTKQTILGFNDITKTYFYSIFDGINWLDATNYYASKIHIDDLLKLDLLKLKAKTINKDYLKKAKVKMI